MGGTVGLQLVAVTGEGGLTGSGVWVGHGRTCTCVCVCVCVCVQGVGGEVCEA